MDSATTASSRRTVAVLFADLCNFTGMVETLEPEAVYGIVRPLLDELVLCVELHDGVIQQVLGDGFMAVFGLDRRDGDEAGRAIRVGLRLVAMGQIHHPIHVGVEYGEVLVTPSWQPAAYGVWGRPVTLAKRLCDRAGPGELLIGPGALMHTEHGGGGAMAARAGSTEMARQEARLKGIAGTVLCQRVQVDDALAPLFNPMATAVGSADPPNIERLVPSLVD
jgi:class 3 adenylate cyclase